MANVAVQLPGANTAAGVTTVQGKDFPNIINDAGKEYTLLTSGLREKTILFVKVKVYALGVYVEKQKLDSVISALGGKAGIEKLQKEKKLGQTFNELIEKNKIPVKICLVSLRDLEGKQVVDGMNDSLKAHMDKADFEGAKKMMSQIIPTQKIPNGECVTMELHTPKPDSIRALLKHKEHSVVDSAAALANALCRIYFTTTIVGGCKENLEKTILGLAKP